MADVTAEGFNITRVFDAPRELVFKAWTTPEHFAYWFGAPLDAPLDRVSLDARPGGEWHLVLLTPDGGEMPFHGVYREVGEPGRLVLTLKDSSAPAEVEGELVTVTFADLGDKTEMAFHQRGGNLTAEQYAQAKEGWSGFFDRLAERVAQL